MEMLDEEILLKMLNRSSRFVKGYEFIVILILPEPKTLVN